MGNTDHREYQRLPSHHHPYGIVRTEGQPVRRKALSVHWHPSVLQRQRRKLWWQIFTVVAILLFFTSFTLAIYKILGCDFATGDCVNLYSPQTNSPEPFGRKGQQYHQSQQAMLAEMFADPEHPYAHEDPYQTEDPLRYTGQIMDTQEYLEEPYEEGTGDKQLIEHNDVTTLGEGGEEEEEAIQVKEMSRGEGSAGTGSLSNGDTRVYEVENEDDGGVIDVEPEDEPGMEMDDDLSRESEIFDALTSHTRPVHRHLLNTGSSSEADIWNEGQDLLTDDDFIELDEDYAAIAAQSAQQETATEITTTSLSLKPTNGDNSILSPHAPSIMAKLDPDTKYMTYLPYAGITNQFYSMLRALMLAKALGRTLIVPPITASSHDNSGQQQPWSTYFDIGTFTLLTNVKVVELHELKNPAIVKMQSTPADQGETGDIEEEAAPGDDLLPPALEPLSCLQTGGFGSWRPLDVTAKEFLRQWGFDLTVLASNYSDELDIERLTASIEEDERIYQRRWQDSEADASLDISQQLLCITNAYKISVPHGLEWDLYGRHFYFSPLLERFYITVMDKLREGLDLRIHNRKQLLPYESGAQPNPPSSLYGDHSLQPQQRKTNMEMIVGHRFPESRGELYAVQPISFISIHARRADFVEHCKSHFSADTIHTCLPSTEHLVATLSRVLARNPTLRHLPILVSTDERRPEELAKFRQFGWYVVDHAHLQSEDRLGSAFGPMMVDQILMARAKLLIGVRTSTFSRVGALRQMDWYNRRAFIL
ncbi:hypothetical protein BGW42_006151 [Actinomortierella wolfii]|nr:hypothetical protein BGW42_006151 [Actinomortierella wolfii]